MALANQIALTDGICDQIDENLADPAWIRKNPIDREIVTVADMEVIGNVLASQLAFVHLQGLMHDRGQLSGNERDRKVGIV